MPEKPFKYQAMFNLEPDHYPSNQELNDLARSMTNQFEVKEDLREDEKKIPAGYTYLGQFINHDIALDSATTPGERIEPWDEIALDKIFNRRTPFLNLETIYGEGAPNGAERRRSELRVNSAFLKLGNTVGEGQEKKVFTGKDLYRDKNTGRPLIVDSRNDDNLAISQTQVEFARFHNTVVKCLGGDDPDAIFDTAQKIVIQHYQRIILEDYLPKMVKDPQVITDAKNGLNRFYSPTAENHEQFPPMPLEFSLGALRSGHSMIRESYSWNRLFNESQGHTPATLVELTKVTGRCGLSITKSHSREQVPSEWLIDWNLFYKTSDVLDKTFNFADPINTRMAGTLGRLPDPAQHNCDFLTSDEFTRERSLAAFDLYRLRALGLPSGQAIAEKLVDPAEILKSEQIDALLPGELKGGDLSKKTPLWFYLLAEADYETHGATLGKVGSYILAETLIGFLKCSPFSILKEQTETIPELEEFNWKGFGMPQMLNFINKYKDDPYDELNPLGP